MSSENKRSALRSNKVAFMQGSSRPLWAAFVLLLACCTLFLTLNIQGDWDFVLQLRLTKLAALLLVAYAVGVSTQLFQTLTNNPILTPSILGFDSLYVFLQTLLLFALGGVGYTSLPLTGKFGFELVMMMGGSLLLFYTLIRQGGRDLSRMILIGVIFGILFRSLSSLLTRMIDPEEFTAAQANMFANFNTVHSELLGVGALILLASAVVVWRERHRLDVHLLGRDQTINLGINYARNTLWLLLWIAALVATATAVVGPVSFFGLLAAALANHFAPSVRHSVRLPMTVCVGGILLVGGQTVFGVLGTVLFLWILLRKPAHVV